MLLCIFTLGLWNGNISSTINFFFSGFLAILVVVPLYRLSRFHHLHGLPGPRIHKITELPMLYYTLRGTVHNKVKALHDRYGRIVQTGLKN